MNNSTTEISNKSVRRVLISPFLDNLGVFNYKFWWFSVFSSSFVIISFILTIIIFSQNLNYLETLGMVQDIMIRIITYFSTSIISGINVLNYGNDLLAIFNITNEKVFNFNVKIINPQLNMGLWAIIIVSFILGLKFQFLTKYQHFYQDLINQLGYYNYYISFFFLFKNWNRKKTKKLYIRLLPILKLEKFNPNSKSEEQTINNFLQIFFDIPLEECSKYKIQIRQKKLFFNTFYSYQIWEVIDKEKNEKVEQPNNENILVEGEENYEEFENENFKVDKNKQFI